MIIEPVNLPKSKRPWKTRKILISTASFFLAALTIILLNGCVEVPPTPSPTPSFTPTPNQAPPTPKTGCEPEDQKEMPDGTVYCSAGSQG